MTGLMLKQGLGLFNTFHKSMAADWICKCKHLESKHTFWMKAHKYDNGSWRPSSECACSVCASELRCTYYTAASNLEYLEWRFQNVR